MKVTAYRKNKSDKETSLVAYVDIVFRVEWGGWFVRGMKEFTKNGHRFVGHPSEKYINEHGEKKYSPYSGLTDRDSSDKFQSDVLKAIDEFCAKQASQITVSGNNNGNIAGGDMNIVHGQSKQEATDNEECPF